MSLNESEMTRTRQSLAGQIAEALDAMQAAGRIVAWSSHYGEPRKAYRIHEQDDFGPFGVRVEYDLTPGEAMDWLNARGFDVRIGRA